ncbi:MAG TPA: sigma 54-interacting transcriptional regulator [Thermodesulfobacteriota bacterium]|nr:sigma 54-interacting transcriptional regulator [Thermodesulfobacteriota bacterium]
MSVNIQGTDNNYKPGVGSSSEFLDIIRQAETYASVPRPILVRGERGTGKELLAHYIHAISNRSEYPYVIVNCAAFQEDLFIADMFGHEKGAFTGADGTKIGKFELANKGTFFLDEVANMSIKVQEKLLRVIEYQSFNRLGGTKKIEVDVRVIAATNAPLEEMMENGEFLPDLYDRLSFAVLVVPPLRKRRDDIPLLLKHFIDQLHQEMPDLEIKSFTKAAVKVLKEYHWPGNIRELKNIVERLYISDIDGVICASELPIEITSLEPLDGSFYGRTKAFKKTILLTTLKDCLGNQREAAAKLGMTYDQFRHYYKKFNLGELLV